MATLDVPARTRRTREVAATARAGANLILLALALLLAARALYYFSTTRALIAWPFEILPGEGTMLHESRLLNAGPVGGLRALYGPQTPDRFIAGNYPPLYLALWALKPGPPGLPGGRVLSLLASFAAAVAGGVAAYAAARGPRGLRVGTGLLAGATFICTVPVVQQIAVAKPDMVAMGCAALGLALFEAAPNRRGAVAAGVCFALALLAKQSIVFALAAAAVAAARRGLPALGALLIGAFGTLAVVLGGLWLLAGPTLYEHLVLYNLRSWEGAQAERFAIRFVGQHWALLAPALGYAGWGLIARPRSALTYYPLLSLLTMVAIGAEGAYRNYYLELCLAMALAAALAVGTALAARPARAATLGGGALLLVTVYVFQAYAVFTLGQYVPVPPVNRTDPNPLLALVDASPDPVFSDEVGLLAMRGRPVVVDDAFLAKLMYRRGRWDNGAVVAGLRARRYSVVITSLTDRRPLEEQWGDDIAEALAQNYRPVSPDSYVRKAP